MAPSCPTCGRSETPLRQRIRELLQSRARAARSLAHALRQAKEIRVVDPDGRERLALRLRP